VKTGRDVSVNNELFLVLILKLVLKPFELFLVLQVFFVAARHLKRVDVQYSQILANVNSKVPTFHEGVLDFLKIGKLSVGLVILEPDSKHVPIDQLPQIFRYCLIMIWSVVISNAWNEDSVWEPLFH
jgi:hypothetical protein